MSKYILGGGISGLVWNFYNPEFTIITPDLGGFYAKTYLVWLHDTSYTRKIISDLGLVVAPKKSYIGYWSKGWIYDYQTDQLNQEIINRKMTPWDQEVKDVKTSTRDLSLSTVNSQNYMNTLDVDLEEVIKRLSKNANIQHGFVVNIGTDTITVKKNPKDETSEILEYSELVSTIPAPFFWKGYGDIKKEFKYVPITSVVVSKMPKWYDNDYEMVYYTKDVLFSRISHLQGKWALEFTGEMTREKFEELYPDLPVLDHVIVKQGRIWETENIPPQPNIIFSGRFSQWKHKIVTENVIAQSIDYLTKKNIINQIPIITQ